MKIKFLLMPIIAASFVFAACDPTEDGPELGKRPGEAPVNKDFPIEMTSVMANGSDVGVTIDVKSVQDGNFVFELRPGAYVQSYKLDVYPLAQLYNYLLNDMNAGELNKGDEAGVAKCIRKYLFVEGSGGYAFSVNDSENKEDFLQKEFDWMNTPYASNSAIVIPDCEYVVAVVASSEKDISSANQEELTLCYIKTPKKQLVGDPQVEMKITTTYRAYQVEYLPNADAKGGVYYFGHIASEIDDFINHFGETMFRDFIRTYYASPIPSDNPDMLTSTQNYGQAADHTVMYTACAVAVDENLTPQEGFARRDFHLEEMPPQEEQTIPIPTITIVEDRIAAGYFEFDVFMPKDCNTVFWGVYSEKDKLAIEKKSESQRWNEALKLRNGGDGCHNENFSWNPDAPDDQKATGSSYTVRLDYYGMDLIPGTTVYVGITGRNGFGSISPITFSGPVNLDPRNYESSDNCKVKDLEFKIDNVTTTSFRSVFTYDPSTVSMIHFQYIPEEFEVEVGEYKTWQELSGMTISSPWTDWVNMIFADVESNPYSFPSLLNINHWSYDAGGNTTWTWTGFTPGYEYVMFLCAEDFDGNISDVKRFAFETKEPQIGPDPTVDIKVENVEGSYEVVFTIDHDVESYKYCITDNISDLKLGGATQSDLNDIAGSGIPYEKWKEAIYQWAMNGLETNYNSVSQEYESDGIHIAGCLAYGRDEKGNNVIKMNHLICYPDGTSKTLEEIFGITEE